MNKLGGVGRINKVNEDGTYGVTYIVLRGSERKVHPMFISHAVLDQGPRPIKEREYFHKEFPLRPSRKRGALAASPTPSPLVAEDEEQEEEEDNDEQEKKRLKKASAVASALALLNPVRPAEAFAREQGDFPPLPFEEEEEEEVLPYPALLSQVKVEVDEVSQMMSLVDGEPSQGAIFVDETTSQAMVEEVVQSPPAVQVAVVEPVVVKSVVEIAKPVVVKPVAEIAKPVVEIAKPVVEIATKPVVESAKPVEITKPVETTKPIAKPIETTKPVAKTTKPVAKPSSLQRALVDHHALERQALEQEFQREQSRLVERFRDSAKPRSSLLQQCLQELSRRFYPGPPTAAAVPLPDVQAFKQQRDELWALQRARALALEELQRATSRTPQPRVCLEPLQAFCEI